MTVPGKQAPLAIPERMWFVNTDMQSFVKVPRAAADDSAFAHWLSAGRLFVTPDAGKPRKYHNALSAMQPGDPVCVYEDGKGFVAIGWVRGPKDLRASNEDTLLYPKPTEMVRSLAVDWDTSVQRSAQHVEQQDVVVAGYALRRSYSGLLHDYLLGMLQEAYDRHRPDPDAEESAAAARIANSTCDSKTKAQLIQARLGQGRFRQAVHAREPACRLTGITEPRCLVASHIKPWSVCDDDEHLDDANGLMLAPHADHLFDTGLISFEDNGQLKVAPALDAAVLRAWHIDPRLNVGSFAPDQARYLAYHRAHVFGRPRIRRQRNLVGDVPADMVAALAGVGTASASGGGR